MLITAIWIGALLICIAISYRLGLNDGRAGHGAPPARLLPAATPLELQQAEQEVAALLGEPAALRPRTVHPRLSPAQVATIQRLSQGGQAPTAIRDLCLYELRAPGWQTAGGPPGIMLWHGFWNERTAQIDGQKDGHWDRLLPLTPLTWQLLARVLLERPVTPRQARVFVYPASGKPVSLADILQCIALTVEEPPPPSVD